MSDLPPPSPPLSETLTTISSTTAGQGQPSPAAASDRGWGPGFTGAYSQFLLSGVIFGAIWLKMDNLLLVLAGYVASNAQTVVGYYFGSSRGSQSKDDTIAKQLPK